MKTPAQKARAAAWYRDHVALAARGDRADENARNRVYYAAHRTEVLARQRARFEASAPAARVALRLRNRDRMRLHRAGQRAAA